MAENLQFEINELRSQVQDLSRRTSYDNHRRHISPQYRQDPNTIVQNPPTNMSSFANEVQTQLLY